jgi:hypothetical protein
VSKRKSIEQTSDGSSSNNNKKNHVGENEDINHDASNISSNSSSGSSGIDRTGGAIKIDDHDYSSHVVTTYDGSSFDSEYVVDIKKKAVKARFYSDIEEMMYGFGDDWPPLRESVNLLDAIAVKYIEDLGKQDGDVDDENDEGDDDMMTTVIVMIMMISAMGRI